jgi:hypothetical protein
MTRQPGTRPPSFSERWRRPQYGAAASLGLFVLARLLANRVYPIGSYPFANQMLFMGTPFLALSFFVHGISSLGLAAANVINAICWAALGAAIGSLVRRPWIAVAVWLLVASGGAALVFAGLVLGMMSSSP